MLCTISSVTLSAVAAVVLQSPPINGIRPSDVRFDAVVHCTLVPEPGVRIEDATVVMRDGWIVAAGPSGTTVIPEGCTPHDATGWIAYAGFVEPFMEVDSSAAARAASTQADAYWNNRVTPHVRAPEASRPDAAMRTALRDQGYCVAAAWPSVGVFRGTGALLTLAEADAHAQWIKTDVGQAIAFDRFTPTESQENSDDEPRGVVFPASRMGAIALVRQVLRDASWKCAADAAWERSPTGQDQPAASAALDSLAPSVRADGADRVPLVFDCTDEHAVLHASALMAEGGATGWCVASGTEFRALDEIAKTGLPLVVPIEFAKAPETADPRRAAQHSLRDLASWACAPMNPSLLAERGVQISLTTHRMRDRSAFAAKLRSARAAGLSPDQTLAAITTAPARLLGMESSLGRVAPGFAAHLVLCDGELAATGTRVRSVWVAGRESVVKRTPTLPFDGGFAMLSDDRSVRGRLDAKRGAVRFLTPPAEGAEAGAPPSFVDAQQVELGVGRVSFVAPKGTLDANARVRVVGEVDGAVLRLEAALPDGTRRSWIASADATVPEPPTPAPGSADGPPPADADDAPRDAGTAPPEAARAVLATAPFGDFGVRVQRTADGARVPAPLVPTVLRNATVWTSAADGVREACDVYIERGVIRAIGPSLKVPDGTTELDCTGKHLTPGLVDCHSHTGILGDVNEWTQACSAEVGIGDVIDPTDINWYRQLAGGLTAANQLHGSANPIGGRNSVVKIKWGEPASAFPVPDAKPGIKFALGENVVRSTDRYPSTRMGVEAFMRDRFRAAAEQRVAVERWNTLSPERQSRTVPPRVDDELTVLAELLAGERVVHCHSYRQDEIVMLLDLAESLGFRIATLQHILEGYKVADRIAKHGAGASSFSDWWAYKMEVLDAVPYNGAVLTGQGVLTSFNSDSDELARRLNTEAAKACRYGGVAPADALKFVTINPAQQLGIGHRTGSIEVGKDADLVVWSNDPLSSYAVCLHTWVEGVKRFDRAEDQARRDEDAALRRALLAYAFESGSTDPPAPSGKRSGPRRAPTLLARMLDSRDDASWELYRRGLDPASVRAGECGCASESMAGGAR